MVLPNSTMMNYINQAYKYTHGRHIMRHVGQFGLFDSLAGIRNMLVFFRNRPHHMTKPSANYLVHHFSWHGLLPTPLRSGVSVFSLFDFLLHTLDKK